MQYNSPRGTRDFLPQEMEIRRSVINTLSSVYTLFGFREWDGPAFENMQTLVGKNNNIPQEVYSFTDKGGRDLGLRFELTTSLARIIATNQDIKKPVRLFNIGKVWRYERPQLGRFREFLQADADIFGSDSMLCEVDLLVMAVKVMEKLGINKESIILLNNRKILEAIISSAQINDDYRVGVFRSLDKLEKIGKEGVTEELQQQGISIQQIDALMQKINISGDNYSKLNGIMPFMNDTGKEGIAELQEIIDLFTESGLKTAIKIDFSLVRGLDYYTGPIYEVKAIDRDDIGSFVGGGRYDNLIESMGGKPTPAVGMSFGVERIIELIKEKNSQASTTPTEVFICYSSPELLSMVISTAAKFREAGITTDFDPTEKNLSKQLSYAEKRNIKYGFIIFSATEQKLKNMQTRSEEDTDSLTAISNIIASRNL